MSTGTPNLEITAPDQPRSIRPASSSGIMRAFSSISDTIWPSTPSYDPAASHLPGEATSSVTEHLAVPSGPPNSGLSSNDRSGAVTPASKPDTADIGPASAITEIRVGETAKSFNVHTSLLTNRSPYFRDLLSSSTASPTTPLIFSDLDEFAFALFVRWLYGAVLHGPSDFHSMQHYIGLYILAQRFRIERLQNEVMDLVRAYYRTGNMTAPAHRLEHAYAHTEAACHMRNFLVATAAYRLLCERTTVLPEPLRDTIVKGGELAVDFAESLIKLHVNGLVDVRRGADCVFHEHRDSERCKRRALEPYQDA